MEAAERIPSTQEGKRKIKTLIAAVVFFYL